MGRILNRNIILNVAFIVFVILVIVTRTEIFFTINTNFIDSDQPPMWLGATHYAQGLFYEPRFYGQDYNTFMEGLFAVPFMKLGMPVYYAVPLATHLIFLFPFFVTAFYLFIKKHKEKAILTLALVLCFPSGFDIMTSIPRGFVTGLFFTSFFILSVLNPNHLKYIFLNTLMAGIGFLVNQNSVLVSAPFLLYLFIKNYNITNYYFYSFGAVFAVLPFEYLLNHFYRVHPDYVFYPLNNIFSIEFFISSIGSLDKRFCNISLFVENKSYVMILIFLFMGIISFIKDKALFFACLAFVGIILFSFFFSKVNDGSNWPFYSYSRMYLGFPVFLILFFCILNLEHEEFFYPMILVVLGFTVYKQSNLKESLASHTDEKNWAFVHLLSLEKTLGTINGYDAICRKEKAALFIIQNGVWNAEYLTCGGPSVIKDFVPCIKTSSERQHWLFDSQKEKVNLTFLFLAADYDFDKHLAPENQHFKISRIDNFGLFKIEENTMKTGDFCKMVDETN